MTFWNICGRAGRAMKENEGQVLFWGDRTAAASQLRRLDSDIKDVLGKLDRVSVVSANVSHPSIPRQRVEHDAPDA